MSLKRILSVLAVLAACATPARGQTPAAAPPPTDVTGTWNLMFNTQDGARPAQLKLKKTGDTLSGAISSDMGETEVTASVKDTAFSASFSMQTPNGSADVVMTGSVTGDTMKGSASIGGSPVADYTGTRAKDEKAAEPAAPASTTAPAGAKTDASGTWNLSMQLPSMTATPSMTLKQDGEKLTGQYISEQYGQFPLSGTLKGGDVALTFTMDIQGNSMTASLTGKLENDQIKGAVSFGDMMSGTFTATRKK